MAVLATAVPTVVAPLGVKATAMRMDRRRKVQRNRRSKSVKFVRSPQHCSGTKLLDDLIVKENGLTGWNALLGLSAAGMTRMVSYDRMGVVGLCSRNAEAAWC